MKQTINEGKALIITHIHKIVSKDMPVFYNPLMKFNRDISILLLNSIDNKELQIADPLAGSGVRAARFLVELNKDKIKSMHINDYNEEAVKLIKKNIKLNEDKVICDEKRRFKIKSSIHKNQNDFSCIEVSQLDANVFLQNSFGFDYIDIDPFGSPNKFLPDAITRMSRDGILAVTATDTAPLCGTYPKTCLRKYFARPIRNEHMHEIGLRILIRKVQLIAAQFDKALIPIFSYSKDHYFRVFFSCTKSKTKVDEIIKQHKYFHYCTKCTRFHTSIYNKEQCCNKQTEYAGPIWSGQLNETKLINKMIKNCDDEKTQEFLKLIHSESKINTVGFYDMHKVAKKLKIDIPRMEIIFNKLNKASRTHFSGYGIKTKEDLLKII